MGRTQNNTVIQFPKREFKIECTSCKQLWRSRRAPKQADRCPGCDYGHFEVTILEIEEDD